MGIASCVSYAGDEITRLAYGDYPCEVSLVVNVLKPVGILCRSKFLIEQQLIPHSKNLGRTRWIFFCQPTSIARHKIVQPKKNLIVGRYLQVTVRQTVTSH